MDTIINTHIWRYLVWICFNCQQVYVNSNIPESPRFRLVGGTSSYNGRVEVALRGKWGTVCDDYFGTNEAKVLCKTLGLPYKTAVAVSSAVYGQGSGNIWLDDIQCNGYESSIARCNSNSIGDHNCKHVEDVGVVCTNNAHRYRLVSGSSSQNGHVQIYTGSGWVAVSHDSFNSQAAMVLCRSLNLPYHAVKVQSYSYTGATWLETMQCNGNEQSLYDCGEAAGTNHNWQRGSMASVTCVGGCNVPSKPVHGDIRMTGTNTRDVTTYSCSSGYNLRGLSSTVCSSNGYWTQSAPSCIPKDCGQLSSPRHGHVHISSTTYQSGATYSCLPGYVIQGQNVTTCLSTGNWSADQPICKPKDCGNLSAPRYGDVHFNNTEFQSNASFNCHPGYNLIGSIETTCLSSGNWSDAVPTCCIKDCGNLTSPDNGEVNVSTTVFQSTATYTCDSGYVLQGSNITRCISTGKWDMGSPTCEPIDCGNLMSPINGQVELTATVFQSIASYTCNSGYYMQGSNSSTCLPSGTWDKPSPTCEPKDCGNPPTLTNGFVEVNGTVFGCIGVYDCDQGYIFSGINVTECLFNGNWSDISPNCSPIDCGLPDLPRNGYVIANSTVYESVALYYCNDGYVQRGSKTATCLSTGEWGNKPPSCMKIDDVKARFCSDDIDERGTTWGATVSGTSVVIPCSCVNKDLIGNVSRYCTEIGSWLLPEYDCLRAVFKQLEHTIQAILTNVSVPAISDALSSLTSVTQTTDSHVGLYSGEISKAADMLDTIANVSSEIAISEEQSRSFVQIVGNLIDAKNQGSWQSTSHQNKKVEKASKVLKAVGKYADAIVKTLTDTNQTKRVVPSKNMVLLAATIDTEEDIHFPVTSVIRTSNISSIVSSFQLDKESVKGATSYSGVIYKNLSGIFPSTIVKTSNSTSTVIREINSAVLAVQLHSNLTHHLPSPIVLQFSHLEERYRDASCVFWNDQRRGWDNSGCRRTSSNLTTTVCECDHLTNFAILMSPWREESVSSMAIDVLSYVGCSISIVCLVVTVVCHLIYWKFLRPHFRTVILMHLCVALVFSYILFLFGADKTENRNICTAMASLLHYIYLAVFFIMLAECIDMAWIVLLPLKQSSRPKWTLTVAWAVPAVIVGTTLGVTKLRGYGTESYCWLSKDNGLIWAFIGPALLVILVNLSVLILVVKALCQTKVMQDKGALARLRSSLWCLLVLLPLTGSSWIIGIFYISHDTEWIQYLFVTCNTLQGFIIFLCHCVFNKQITEAIRQKRKRKRRSTLHSESMSKSSRFHLPFSFKRGSNTYTFTETSSSSTRL